MGSRSKQYSREGHRIAERRRLNFVARYRANPMNYLPEPVRHYIYCNNRSQKDMERAAARWIEGENRSRKIWGIPPIETDGWSHLYE